MKIDGNADVTGLAVFLGSLLAALFGCNVAVNPFDLSDTQPSRTGDSEAECTGVGGDSDLDTGAARPCTNEKDCLYGYVCRTHMCVPLFGDGGWDGQVPPDGEGNAGDAGALDGSCIEGLEPVPSTVDFGIVTMGCNSRDISVALINTGCLEQVVATINVIPETGSIVMFSIPQLPFIVEPGTSKEIGLRYHPRSVNGPESMTLRVQTFHVSFDIPLRGTATSSALVTDAFVQGPPPSASFHLSRWPDPGTIVVMVNGTTVAEGGVSGWSYDEGDNNIVFGTNAVPPSSAEISIAYEAECF